MTAATRCFRLRARPVGAVTEDDLELCTEEVPAIAPGQALGRTLCLSLDPTNRIWMSDMRSYIDPVRLGDVMRGIGIAEIVESRREDMAVGDLVVGGTGWAEHVVIGDGLNDLPFSVLPSPLPGPIPAFLGVLGHTGITAYLGLEDIGRPQAGETVVVSAAAGAVGSVAGQLAKHRYGCRVVGIARGAQKCAHVVEGLGFDACVDYTSPDWLTRLDAACPDGIDVDFENVGGEIMDEVFLRLNLGARVVLCGMISQYNDSQTGWGGQRQIGQMIMRRVMMKSFVVLDHADRFPEAIEVLAGALAAGRIVHEETVVDGLEHARDAINALFEGRNRGKLLIKVADPVAADAPEGAGAAATPTA